MNDARLPDAPSPEAFDAFRREESRLRPGVEAIRARLGLGAVPLTRFPDGSLPVYALGDSRVLKLYPPCFPGERDREAAALRAVERRLPWYLERLPLPTGVERLEALAAHWWALPA